MIQALKIISFVNKMFTIINKSLLQVFSNFLSKCTNILINTNII